MANDVYLGLGSNLDSPRRQLSLAVEAVRSLPKTAFISKSRLYKTLPLGPKAQGVYFNMVVLIQSSLTPEQLLDYCQSIEQSQGRVRKKRWGPRSLDIDILLFGDLYLRTQRLTLPHPEMQKRDFVMVPLMEVWRGKGIMGDVKNCKRHIISVR